MATNHVIAICIALATFMRIGDTAGDNKPPPKRTLAVVVAKGSKVGSLSKTELRRAFKSESIEAGGQRLIPFNYPPRTSERVAFDRAVLDMSSDEVGRFWVDRKIRGQTAAPRTLPSASHVAKLVAKFPGAIGYLPSDQVTADLKVIAIDGETSIDW